MAEPSSRNTGVLPSGSGGVKNNLLERKWTVQTYTHTHSHRQRTAESHVSPVPGQPRFSGKRVPKGTDVSDKNQTQTHYITKN